MATLSGGKKLSIILNRTGQNLGKKKAIVRIGFLENAKYPNGTPVALVAAIQDFGAPSRGIPPRPFFRNMIVAKSGEWPEAMAKLLKANNYDTKKTLEQTGAAIAGQLRQSIIDTNTPPNAPSTLASKKGNKPLVDTGHMLASVDYEVKVP